MQYVTSNFAKICHGQWKRNKIGEFILLVHRSCNYYVVNFILRPIDFILCYGMRYTGEGDKHNMII